VVEVDAAGLFTAIIDVDAARARFTTFSA